MRRLVVSLSAVLLTLTMSPRPAAAIPCEWTGCAYGLECPYSYSAACQPRCETAGCGAYMSATCNWDYWYGCAMLTCWCHPQ
jgi:hypothetical protein